MFTYVAHTILIILNSVKVILTNPSGSNSHTSASMKLLYVMHPLLNSYIHNLEEGN